MAAEPISRPAVARATRLDPFHSEQAELIASWVLNREEAYWIAPRTVPPITAASIRGWDAPGHQRFVLTDLTRGAAMAYGELNRMPTAPGHFWLGHLVVAPAERGRGVGQALTRALMQRGFLRHGAVRITLVVMPENTRALACYRAAGLREDGYEAQLFPIYNTSARLIRLVATPIY